MNEYALQIRKMFGEGDAVRDAGLKTPKDVERFDDISYGKADEKWQKLDVYRPKKAKGKILPVILSIHGGGWVYGDKDVYQWYCMSLAQRGFAVVNFSYRLAPEYQYPASFEDTSSVASWILKNAGKYGFDTKHIFGVGDSAGGQMLSLFAAALTNPKYKPDFKLPKGFAFQAIALNCGAYKMDAENTSEMSTNLMKALLPKHGTKKEMKQLSSYHFVTPDYPPVFIMTCPGDFLFNEPETLIPVLKANAVPYIYRVYGSKKNPLAHVFHCNMKSADGKLCNDEECSFFKEFCND
jgi:acetyl esterase/lipase